MTAPSADRPTDQAPSRIDLPLSPIVQRTGTGWAIRVPVRAEQVHVQKRSVVREEIRLKTNPEIRRVRLDGQVRREVADVELAGAIEVDRDEPDHLQERYSG